jgi:drug/metabolite transporter (DMT)-like permease
VFGALFLLPVVLLLPDQVSALPSAVAPLLVLTGFFQALYSAGLAMGYRSGDLSFVYPLVRALPVLLVTLLTLVLGTQAPLTSRAWLGAGLVFLGCLLLPLARFRDFRLAPYARAPAAFAALAATGAAGYSLVDSEGLRILRTQLAATPSWKISLAYLVGQAVTTAAWLVLYSAVAAPAALARSFREQRSSAAFIGAAAYVTYGLVLWAMNYATNVSYVVAFRQMGIVLAVGLGLLVLREPAHPPKVLGAAVVVSGLVFMALG